MTNVFQGHFHRNKILLSMVDSMYIQSLHLNEDFISMRKIFLRNTNQWNEWTEKSVTVWTLFFRGEKNKMSSIIRPSFFSSIESFNETLQVKGQRDDRWHCSFFFLFYLEKEIRFDRFINEKQTLSPFTSDSIDQWRNIPKHRRNSPSRWKKSVSFVLLMIR